MEVQAAGKAVVRGCYDSFKGISAYLSINNELEREQNLRSPLRNINFKGKVSERIKQFEERKAGRSKVKNRIFVSSLLNGGLFLFSIFLFNLIILPGIRWSIHLIFREKSFMGKLTWLWVEPILSFIFTTTWVVPLFLLIKCVNSVWFQDIADSAYLYTRGRPLAWQSLGVWIADLIFSIIVQTLFLIQAMLVNYIPIYALGYLLYFIHMCLLYSLYAFEYRWYNMGWELHRRLAYIERNWPYFIGFGLPLTIITELSNSWVISGGLFSLLFPFFILSGNEANPTDNVGVYPLRLFSPVIAVSSLVFSYFIRKKPVDSMKQTVPKSPKTPLR